MFPHGARRRVGAGLLVAGALVTISACSSDPDIEVGDPSDPSGDPVVAASASQSAIWGHGRALLARDIGNGSTAVVTTTGVLLEVGADAAPVTMHTFAEPTLTATMEVSPAGDTLLVATSTPTRLLWFDLTTRELTRSQDLEVNSSISSLAFLPDGVGIIAATTSGLAAWPEGPVSGPVPLTDAASPTGSAAVLADGRVIAPLSDTDALAVIDGLATSFETLGGIGEAQVVDAHADPGGTTLAVTAGIGANVLERDDRIVVLDPASLTVRSEIAFDRPLSATDWAVTDSYVAVADGGELAVRSLEGDSIADLGDASKPPITRVIPYAGGVAVTHSDGTITAWDSAAWNPVDVRAGGIRITDASVDPGATTITTVDVRGGLARWDMTTGTAVIESERFALGEATGVDIDADALRVGVSTTAGRAVILDASLTEQWVFDPATGRVDTIEFNPVDGAVTTGLAERTGAIAFDDTVATWDPTTQTERFTLGGESEDVAGCAFFYNRVRFTGDGELMATTSHDFSVAIVDSDTGGLVHLVPPRVSTVLDLAYTPDDDLLIATSDDASVAVFDTSDYSTTAEYQASAGGYLSIAVLPDSATMAASDITGGIALVDIITGERLLEFADARHRTNALAISADGTMLAAPAENSTIGLWSVDSGARLATLSGHTAAVTDVEFSPDGSWLVSSSLDATVRTWAISATT